MVALATSSFDTTVLVLGGLLVLGAFLAGLAHRSFLSLTAVFVVAGFALGDGGAKVLHFDPLSGFVTGHNVPVDGGTKAGGGWFFSPSERRFVNRPRTL